LLAAVHGRYAAVAAKQLGATVALVEPGQGKKSICSARSAHASRFYPNRNLTQQLSDGYFGIPLHTIAAQNYSTSVVWAEGADGLRGRLKSRRTELTAVLAALGVDFIQGTGQFERQPHLAFTVNKRRQARAY